MSLQPTSITVPPGAPSIAAGRDVDATAALLLSASADPEFVTQWLGGNNA